MCVGKTNGCLEYNEWRQHMLMMMVSVYNTVNQKRQLMCSRFRCTSMIDEDTERTMVSGAWSPKYRWLLTEDIGPWSSQEDSPNDIGIVRRTVPTALHIGKEDSPNGFVYR